NQNALDAIARLGLSNAQFEVNAEEGLDLVEEFYSDEVVESEQAQTDSKIKAKPKFNQGDGFVQDMQKGLQLSVHALN
ncbi:hydrolase or metal-binding protein, partial [Acinetobacter variabilis]